MNIANATKSLKQNSKEIEVKNNTQVAAQSQDRDWHEKTKKTRVAEHIDAEGFCVSVLHDNVLGHRSERHNRHGHLQRQCGWKGREEGAEGKKDFCAAVGKPLSGASTTKECEIQEVHETFHPSCLPSHKELENRTYVLQQQRQNGQHWSELREQTFKSNHRSNRGAQHCRTGRPSQWVSGLWLCGTPGRRTSERPCAANQSPSMHPCTARTA